MDKKWIKNGLTVIFLVIMLYAGTQLFLILRDYHQGDVVYNEAQTEFLETPELEEEFTVDETVTWPEFRVDFKELQFVNPDVCGWIYQYDSVINYPILRSSYSNDTYLKMTYDGKSNSAGSIFMDYRNKQDYSDDNTVIYGHNMRNGKMFASLKKYRDQDYADQHNSFYIMTPEGNRRYEVVSAFETDALSGTYSRNFNGLEDKKKWISRVIQSSVVETYVPVNENDKFVTLSTCVSGNDYRARFVVIGVFAGMEPVYGEAE